MAQILGIGIDIIEIPRIRRAIENRGDPFLRKVFTPSEVAYCRSKKDCWASFAARWAAKEAVFKAYGHGWNGIWWLNQIEVIREPSGKPVFHLLEKANLAQASRGVVASQLSLTHGRELAFAQAMILGN